MVKGVKKTTNHGNSQFSKEEESIICQKLMKKLGKKEEQDESIDIDQFREKVTHIMKKYFNKTPRNGKCVSPKFTYSLINKYPKLKAAWERARKHDKSPSVKAEGKKMSNSSYQEFEKLFESKWNKEISELKINHLIHEMEGKKSQFKEELYQEYLVETMQIEKPDEFSEFQFSDVSTNQPSPLPQYEEPFQLQQEFIGGQRIKDFDPSFMISYEAKDFPLYE